MSAWRLHVVLKCVTPWSLYNGSVTCQNCLMLYTVTLYYYKNVSKSLVLKLLASVAEFLLARTCNFEDVDLHTYMSKITCDTVADCSANQRSADAPPELVSVLGQWVRLVIPVFGLLFDQFAQSSEHRPNRHLPIYMLCQQNCHKNWSRMLFIGKVNSCFRSIKISVIV